MNTDKQLPVIERNFHILNDDRFIMEKISLPVEQQEGEDIHAALNRTRETIVQNFKAAYPKVYTHLNFDEVIDYRNDVRSIQNNPLPNNNSIKNVLHSFTVPPEPPNHSNEELIAMQEQAEKINKGTIEESRNYHSPDIETIKKEIKSYKYGAKALKTIYGEMVKDSPELQKVFDEKVNELENQKQNSIV